MEVNEGENKLLEESKIKRNGAHEEAGVVREEELQPSIIGIIGYEGRE